MTLLSTTVPVEAHGPAAGPGRDPAAFVPTAADVTARLRPVFQRHGILKAILFGSVARGEATRKSDVDLILVQETDARFLDRYLGLLSDLNSVMPGLTAVEPWIYTPAEFEAMKERRFVKRALAEGQVIYERESEQA